MRALWLSSGAAVFIAILLGGCAEKSSEESEGPAKAGDPLTSLDTLGYVAGVQKAALAGDGEAVRREMAEFQDEFRKSIKLADPARAVDREAARQAARSVPGVRSVAWVDREILFVIVDANEARSYATLDGICLALEPLGDTLGVVVNLQSGAARTGDELELLSRNCQLEPGDRALLSQDRQLDVVDPAVRAQHKANQILSAQSEEDLKRQQESLRILEANTPSVHD